MAAREGRLCFAKHVSGWETILAAIGGLVGGFGIGVVVARRREQRMIERTRALEARVKQTVLPILDDRAEALGLSRSKRPERADPILGAVELAQTIQRVEERNHVQYSDTLELSRTELERRTK
jgi:hypothetical protein